MRWSVEFRAERDGDADGGPDEWLIRGAGRVHVCGRAQFVYINASFCPAPDDTVANLFKVSINCLFSALTPRPHC